MLNQSLYENPSGAEQISSEHDTFFEIDKITYDDGIKQWFKNAEFPYRGLCSNEAMFAICQIKRLIVASTRVIIIGRPSKLLDIFTDWSWKIISPYILKYEYLTPVAQELQDITYSFLNKMGFNELVALRFSKIFSHLIEYDNAYRYRVQDIFDLTYKEEMVKKPIKTIKYMMSKMAERDVPEVAIKFKRISWILTALLLIPKVRKAFKESIDESDFKKLQIDPIDFYWLCMREDYKFMGYTNEQRKTILKSRKWRVPISKKFKNVI